MSVLQTKKVMFGFGHRPPLTLIATLGLNNQMIMCLDVRIELGNVTKSAACAIHAARFLQKSQVSSHTCYVPTHPSS